MMAKSRPGATLSLKESLYLATKGGAESLALRDVGSFEVGMRFDALHVDPYVAEGMIEAFEEDKGDLERLVEKFLHNGDDRNILAVWVQGRLVHGAV